MNLAFGVPALAGPDRLKAGHRTRWHGPHRFMVPMQAQSERGLSMNLPLPRELPRRARGPRPRSPVAACGPRQHPWKITPALVFARPLRAGTARGPNLIGSWSQCMHKNEWGLPMNRDSQTRMTNEENRRNDQIRM